MSENDKSLVLSSNNKLEKVGNLISITNKLTNVEFNWEKWWDELDRGWKNHIISCRTSQLMYDYKKLIITYNEYINQVKEFNNYYIKYKNYDNYKPNLDEIKNLDYFDIMICLAENGGGAKGIFYDFDNEPNGFSNIINLKNINYIKICINYLTNFKGEKELENVINYKFDLSLLNKFPKLEKLMISDWCEDYGSNFSNYDLIYTLKNLKSLEIIDAFYIFDFNKLKNLINLENLSITNDIKYTNNLSNLHKNNKLKSLILKQNINGNNNYINNNTIINISKCSNLSELELSIYDKYIDKNIDFSPLNKVKKLKLYYYDLLRSKDIELLSNIENIEDLEISLYCHKIEKDIDYGNFILFENLKNFKFHLPKGHLKFINLSDFLFNNLDNLDIFIYDTYDEDIVDSNNKLTIDIEEVKAFLYNNENCYLTIHYDDSFIKYIYTNGEIYKL